MGTSSGCFCNSNLALGSVPLPFPISAGLAGASLQDPRLVPAWCPLASCARASGGSRPQVPCRAGGRDGRLEEGGGHARRVPPEGRRGDCGLLRGVAWCCEPPGWLPMWDRGAVGIESSLWAVGGVGASSHTVQAGRPAPGPSQRVSSTLTEPQCCFLGIPSGGGQGSWHSQACCFPGGRSGRPARSGWRASRPGLTRAVGPTRQQPRLHGSRRGRGGQCCSPGSGGHSPGSGVTWSAGRQTGCRREGEGGKGAGGPPALRRKGPAVSTGLSAACTRARAGARSSDLPEASASSGRMEPAGGGWPTPGLPGSGDNWETKPEARVCPRGPREVWEPPKAPPEASRAPPPGAPGFGEAPPPQPRRGWPGLPSSLPGAFFCLAVRRVVAARVRLSIFLLAPPPKPRAPFIPTLIFHISSQAHLQGN